MGSSDKNVSTLVELGLNPSQAKVYLSLANSKFLTAQEISKISGVARPDAYRVLCELENGGFVEKTITKPKQFSAIPLDDCVSNLIQRRIRRTAELQKKARSLVQTYRQMAPKRETDEEFQFLLLQNRDEVYNRAEKMLRNVQDCVCLLGLTRRMLAWLSRYSPLLEERLSKGVECRMVMPRPEIAQELWEPLNKLVRFPNFALRLGLGEPRAGFSVWDRKEILITTSVKDSPTPALTLWSNNESIVSLAQDHFECLWKKAEKTSLNV